MLGVELSDVQAKLLLSAMMTDTLMLKSPTTTDVDRAVAAKLGEQVGVDPVKFGMEVFLTRPSGSFTAAEMVGNDIKMFEPAGKKLLIGQYETVDKSRALGMIDEIREAMRAYAARRMPTALSCASPTSWRRARRSCLRARPRLLRRAWALRRARRRLDAGRPLP